MAKWIITTAGEWRLRQTSRYLQKFEYVESFLVNSVSAYDVSDLLRSKWAMTDKNGMFYLPKQQYKGVRCMRKVVKLLIQAVQGNRGATRDAAQSVLVMFE